ncbi:MAG: hypothetical protein HYS86_02295 [Candidatus Chisholmbacteria bacterium]|nr:hypothetical protein [Candidatus Chisholmbacteria bacterium]
MAEQNFRGDPPAEDATQSPAGQEDQDEFDPNHPFLDPGAFAPGPDGYLERELPVSQPEGE